jgi:hypothetical protein
MKPFGTCNAACSGQVNRATAQPRNRATAQPRNRATAQPRNSARQSPTQSQPDFPRIGKFLLSTIEFSTAVANLTSPQTTSSQKQWQEHE